MAKSAVLVLDITDNFPKLVPLTTDSGKLLLTSSEDIAKKYVRIFNEANPKKIFIFYVLIDDPTSYFLALKKEVRVKK